jgi:hypothetical protein
VRHPCPDDGAGGGADDGVRIAHLAAAFKQPGEGRNLPRDADTAPASEYERSFRHDDSSPPDTLLIGAPAREFDDEGLCSRTAHPSAAYLNDDTSLVAFQEWFVPGAFEQTGTDAESEEAAFLIELWLAE